VTSRKKPGVAFWATVVMVVVLVAYPLSFGPACWITSRIEFGANILPVAYQPVIWIWDMTPDDGLVRHVIGQFTEFGAAEGWTWAGVGLDSTWGP